MKALPVSLLALLLTLASSTALARSTDRNQPMDIDAGHFDYTLDDSRPTVASRGVTISQGTLDIRSARAVITQRDGQAVRVVLTGSPARLSQQLDSGDPMNAVANEVDYDLRSEVVVFTGDVRIAQPSGSISGQRVVYNMQTGRVQGGGEGAGRVRMRIMPRNNGAASDNASGDNDDAQNPPEDSDAPEGG